MSRRTVTRRATRWLGVGAVVAGGWMVGGCLQILGDEGPFVLDTSSAGGSGGSTATGGSTGGTTSSDVCSPGTKQACYTGPAGTQDVGNCKAGEQTCAADGQSYGECVGEITPQAEDPAVVGDEACDGYAPGEAIWSSIWPTTDGVIVSNVKADSQGNMVVWGLFQGSLTLGATTLNAPTEGPIFVAKLSPTGDVLWAKALGGTTVQFQFGFNLALDSNDNIYIGANFKGTLDLGGSPLAADGIDFAIVKLTPSGVHVWSTKYGGQNDQELWDLAVDKAGNVRAAGIYKLSMSIGGLTNGSGAFVAKISASSGFAGSAMSVDVGEYASPQLALGPNNEWILSGYCPDGSYIAGTSYTPCGKFMVKFDVTDTAQWAQTIPIYPSDIQIDSKGDILAASPFSGSVMVGNTMLTSNGSDDIGVVKYDGADGSIQWAKSWGGPAGESYAELFLGAQDRFYLTFTAQDTIDFGNGPLMQAGLGDTFLAAFDSDGKSRWSRVFGDATYQQGSAAARPDGKGVYIAVGTAGDIDFGAGNLHSDTPAIAVAQLAP